jgi:hypothetical protein
MPLSFQKSLGINSCYDTDLDRLDYHVATRLYEISGKIGAIYHTNPAITAVEPVQKVEFMGIV